MGKSRTSKRKHASKRKLANKTVNKQLKRQRQRKKSERNTRGDSVRHQSFVSQNIVRNNSNFSTLNELGDGDEQLSEEQLDALLNKGVNRESLFAQKQWNTTHSRKRKKENESTADYEKVPRKLSKQYIQEKTRNLLPIKTQDGIIEQDCFQAPDDNDHDEDADDLNEDFHSEVIQEENNHEITVAQLFAERHNYFKRTRTLIAEICHSILENPEENIGQMKVVLKLCDKNELLSTRKMAIVSTCEVFKDIAPGYRIRPLTDEEKAAKVSKDVKRLRDFEEKLISSYRTYLDLLEVAVNEGVKANRIQTDQTDADISQPLKGLGILAVRCLADLLKSLPHFNYRTNIMACLVPKMDLGGNHNEIVTICASAMKDVFKSDLVGEVSLEVVKLISKYTKSRLKKVHPVLLEILLHLNIDPELIKSADQQENKLERLKKKREEIRKMSRTERKRKKMEEKLNQELKEAEAFESHSKLQKLHTEILKFVFVIYFRVLKVGRRTPLLSAALKGLSKYAYLINIDFYQDLMNSLKDLMSSENLSLNESMNCVLTALKVLTGQGSALTIDPYQFYLHLYAVLLDIQTAPSEDVELCGKCLELMLIKRRKQVSFQRLIGFLKRSTTMMMQLPLESIYHILCILKSVLQLNNRCDCMLDSESFGRGLFRPDLPDPEHCNADGTALWELCLSTKHYCTEVKDFSNHLLYGAPSQGIGSLNSQTVKRLSSFKDEPLKMDFFFPSTIPAKRPVKNSSKKIHWYSSQLDKSISGSLSWAEQACQQMSKVLC